MVNIIIPIVLVLIVGGAIAYIIKAKKNGAKCIGCPSGGCCSQNKGESCNCTCQTKTE
ncbi:MAG: FeoB-associated Cys-rich membrane protein [Clostridia bacterium]|nr:FeoB-associated Cys-rich membrane protein [Clostridia bacterium]